VTLYTSYRPLIRIGSLEHDPSLLKEETEVPRLKRGAGVGICSETKVWLCLTPKPMFKGLP
jgi:hypothetical protein